MKTTITENARKMLAVNNKVLSVLHNTFGFDFESETSNVRIFEVTLPATLNKIVKDYKLSKDDFNVLLIQDRHDKQEFRAVVFNNIADFKINGFSISHEGRALYNYYRKSDFNEDRKNAGLKCFLVTTKNSEMSFTMADLKEYEKRNVKHEREHVLSANYQNDTTCLNRIKFDTKDIRTCCFGNNHESTVYGVWNAKLVGYNFSFDIDYGYVNCRNTTNSINDLFDKSGYNVKVKREDLKFNARQLRADRELTLLTKADFTEENRKIEERICNTKNILIERLKNVDFENEKYKQILNNLSRLQTLYNDFKRHEEKLTNAKNGNKEYHYYNYGSIQDVEAVVKHANETIDLILELKFKY